MSLNTKTHDNPLAEFRTQLDKIDMAICALLAQRNELSLLIGEQKRVCALPCEDLAREEEILSCVEKACTDYPNEARAVFSEIISQSKRIQRRSFNLYLVGMPNSGKTRLASRLSAMLGRPFVDTDAAIMQADGRSIDEIFDSDGEAYFRKLEREALIDAARTGGLIVATGGGILTQNDNIPIIENSGIVVFLDRRLDKLINADTINRPLIKAGKDAVYKLYSERIETYRLAADMIIDPDLTDADERIADFYFSSIGLER